MTAPFRVSCFSQMRSLLARLWMRGPTYTCRQRMSPHAGCQLAARLRRSMHARPPMMNGQCHVQAVAAPVHPTGSLFSNRLG